MKIQAIDRQWYIVERVHNYFGRKNSRPALPLYIYATDEIEVKDKLKKVGGLRSKGNILETTSIIPLTSEQASDLEYEIGNSRTKINLTKAKERYYRPSKRNKK
jgi:hypothetical protein|tara:strand:+ start:169 stop:480 length:312 start_codon:yes stop_codon:yes gene_type:complete